MHETSRDVSDREPSGEGILYDPRRNREAAFTEDERDAWGLRGLLPPAVFTQEMQVALAMEQFRNKPNDIERYVYLTSLHDRNESLFYYVLMGHIEQMMPIIYTPTVGQACQFYGRIMRRPQGMYFSIKDRGHIARILANWPRGPVGVIVVTDGERILGLGDLGAYGMGIPIGKLALYTACAGVDPNKCLPVLLDVGTDNEKLLSDPFYIGVREPRRRGADYDEWVDEFISAVTARWPGVLVQFEDFGNANAFRLLHRYRDQLCCFNDDIQGTAAVALAGIYSALRVVGTPLTAQKILFLGAGEAGTGIGELVVKAMVEEGMDEAAARRRCWFVDSQGLVVKDRANLAEHKKPFAHDHEGLPDFSSAMHALRPTAIIGVAAQGGAFDEDVLTTMGNINHRPIVFALSNPTSKAECTAEHAYRLTDGRALFASGSPFPPVTLNGKTLIPGQGNNVYIFPGMGMGIIACGLERVPEELFLVAAQTLARQVTETDLQQGLLYPPLRDIRSVSSAIANAVAEKAYAMGLARVPRPENLADHIAAHTYDPTYDKLNMN